MNGPDLPHHENEWDKPPECNPSAQDGLLPHEQNLPEAEPHKKAREAFDLIAVILCNMPISPEKDKALMDLTNATVSGLKAIRMYFERKN